MTTDIIKNIGSTFSKFTFKLGNHSPEILAVAGTIGVVASAVMACKSTTKIDTILEKTREDVEKVHEGLKNHADEYTEDDSKRDLVIIYAQAAYKFVKLYAPSVVLGVASLGCLLASNHILRRRNIALAAAYATIDKGFKEYRERVVERFGETVDRELKYGIKARKITETEVDPETGEEKKVKKTVDVFEGYDGYSQYARFFDECSKCWVKDAELNLAFLRGQQKYFNDLLRARGHVFLNEVYDALDIPRSKAGQVVGWIYDPNRGDGDNFVDFGIYEGYRETNRDFVNGYERSILLDFNVDGDITTKFELHQ